MNSLYKAYIILMIMTLIVRVVFLWTTYRMMVVAGIFMILATLAFIAEKAFEILSRAK